MTKTGFLPRCVTRRGNFLGFKKAALREPEEGGHRPEFGFINALTARAERIAEHIFKKILSYLPELSGTNPDCPILHAVDVYETPTSRARFTAE